jgi:DNA-binding response OmpR family regulator
VIRLGELPLKLGLFAYYNAVRPFRFAVLLARIRAQLIGASPG